MADSVYGASADGAGARSGDANSRSVDVEAARGSTRTDPSSADWAVSVIGRLFRLAPQLVDLIDLGAREYGLGFARRGQ